MNSHEWVGFFFLNLMISLGLSLDMTAQCFVLHQIILVICWWFLSYWRCIGCMIKNNNFFSSQSEFNPIHSKASKYTSRQVTVQYFSEQWYTEFYRLQGVASAVLDFKLWFKAATLYLVCFCFLKIDFLTFLNLLVLVLSKMFVISLESHLLWWDMPVCAN